MDRTEYLEMCRKVAMLPNGICGMKEVPPELCVKSGQISFYPVGYTLSFDKDGKTVHTANLHDLRTHTIVHCDLMKIERV